MIARPDIPLGNQVIKQAVALYAAHSLPGVIEYLTRQQFGNEHQAESINACCSRGLCLHHLYPAMERAEAMDFPPSKWKPELTLLKFHEAVYTLSFGGANDIGPYGLILTLTGMELLGLAVIYAGLFFVFKDRHKT